MRLSSVADTAHLDGRGENDDGTSCGRKIPSDRLKHPGRELERRADRASRSWVDLTALRLRADVLAVVLAPPQRHGRWPR